MPSADSQRRGELSSTVGVAILAASATAFVVEQASIASVNGWWNDELYSMWTTDSTFTFRKAFGYFGYDNTPPLFYTALYWVRRLIGLPVGHERIWGYILSICAILLASAAVVSASRRVGLTGFALAGIGAFLVSGPVLEYVPEVRAYLMAMAIVFVASWYTALAIETSLRLPATCWAVVGVLAALTHLYSAIVCGGLAVGLILLAAFGGRRDMAVPGLTMGLSASGTYAVWSFVMGVPKRWITDHWIKFTFTAVRQAAAESRQLEIGDNIAFALLLSLFVCAVVHRSTRLLTAVFGTAFAVLYILPILVSFKAPIIHERYWMIGGPALVVVLVFLARAGLSEGIHNKSHTMPLAIGAGAVALLISSSATGFAHARLLTERKFFWGGTRIVVSLARNCPAASIHVLGQESNYALVAELPVQMFVAADTHPDLPASTLNSCPVLGWAEDLYAQKNKTVTTTDKDMLNLLQIDASPSDVDIRRQSTGYVVLRRNP